MPLVGWPRALVWSDFGEIDARPAGVNEDAQISSETLPDEEIRIERGRDGFRLVDPTVEVQRVAADTWVVKGRQSDALLNHEQGHFDVLGLTAREFHDDLVALRTRTLEQLRQAVPREQRRIQRKATTLNARYETETDHGRNRDAQTRWDRLIRDCITNGRNLPER